MQEDSAGAPRAVIVVSSHVVRGSVGNRAKVFTLEALGFPVWAVPTVILPWRPDLAPGERIVPDPEQFARLLADMGSAEWLGEVTAVLSGYFGDAGQVEPVEKLVHAVKVANPNALYLCDPVIGDEGGLYVPVETATAIRERLLPIADIATPSRHELEWLAGRPLPSTADILAAARDLAPPTMLVTSAPSMMAKSMGNLLVTGKGVWLAEHRVIEGEPKGTGDLTSALFLARILNGEDGAKALEATTASVLEIVTRAAKRGANELMLQTDAASLSHPVANVTVRQLLQPRRRKEG
ncbi:MAG: pyridoxal kinase PdxY [Rhizobiales bacterium]|nr:pyridoxal kinase PdxY [Hyphomicrobiales bacterium]